MRSGLPLILTLYVAGIFPCLAGFEKWTNKAGKTAEMELSGMEEKAGKVLLRFTTRSGSAVSFDLQDLSEADQLRARQWKPGGALRAKYRSYRVLASGGDQTEFVLTYEASDGNFAVNAPVEAIQPSLKVGGQPVQVDGCDAMFEYVFDPFSEEGKKEAAEGPPKLELRIKARMREVDIESCEFGCELDCRAGANRNQVSGFFVAPKERVGERQQLGPLSVRMAQSYYAVAEDDPRDHGDLAGYYMWIDRDPETDGDQDESVISRTFVVNGRERGEHLEPEQAGGRIQIRVDYWSDLHAKRISLNKSAAEKGVKVVVPDPFEDGRKEKKGSGKKAKR
jgi:hypothetical protein